MKLPIRFLARLKRPRRLSLERGLDARLNTELTALRRSVPPSAGMAGAIDSVRGLAVPAHKKFRRASRKHFLPRLSLAMTATLLLFCGTYWRYIERDPMMAPATQPFPEYTAYLTYVQALPHCLPISAFDKQTREALGVMEPWQEWHENDAKFPKPQATEKFPAAADALLSGEQTTLRDIRRVLNLPYFDPNQQGNVTRNEMQTRMKPISDLLVLDALTAWKHGNLSAAIDKALDALQFATQVQQNSTLGAKLYTQQWERPARDILWDIVPKLDAPTLAHAMKRMDIIQNMSFQGNLALSLQREKEAGQRALLDLFHETNWRWAIFRRFPSGYGEINWQQDSTWNSLMQLVVSCQWSKRAIYANYTDYMNREIGLSQRPYVETKDELTRPHWGMTGDPISGTLAPYISIMVLRERVSQTENKLLRATMTLAHYRLLNGEYSKDLSAGSGYGLAGKQHQTFDFTDPFAIDAKHPLLHYRLTNAGFLLYSVGPDGKDDSGSAIVNAPQAGAHQGLIDITPESQGDIVAGVNRGWR